MTASKSLALISSRRHTKIETKLLLLLQMIFDSLLFKSCEKFCAFSAKVCEAKTCHLMSRNKNSNKKPFFKKVVSASHGCFHGTVQITNVSFIFTNDDINRSQDRSLTKFNFQCFLHKYLSFLACNKIWHKCNFQNQYSKCFSKRHMTSHCTKKILIKEITSSNTLSWFCSIRPKLAILSQKSKRHA